MENLTRLVNSPSLNECFDYNENNDVKSFQMFYQCIKEKEKHSKTKQAPLFLNQNSNQSGLIETAQPHTHESPKVAQSKLHDTE